MTPPSPVLVLFTSIYLLSVTLAIANIILKNYNFLISVSKAFKLQLMSMIDCGKGQSSRYEAEFIDISASVWWNDVFRVHMMSST